MARYANLLLADTWKAVLEINRADSIENWGSPEERERCAWYAVGRPDETPMGTLVLHSFNSPSFPAAPNS